MKIALTGGIACGKSLAASYMTARGAEVCEADALGHAALEQDSEVYAAVVARFGDGALTEAGDIDRRILGRRVFESAEDRAALNALVHPVVEREWTAWLSRVKDRPAVVVVPLLYEAGYGSGWDAVVCVSASRSVRMARLRERGMTDAEAKARIDAQWPEEKKIARADCVLWNDATRECLATQVDKVWNSIKRG